MLYLILAVVVLSGLLVWAVSVNFKKRKTIKGLENASEKMADAEKEKGAIRDETAETEKIIVDNPGVDHGVMSVSSKGRHNHGIGSPCVPGCPLYGRD